MNQTSDRAFIRRFSLVIFGLVVFTGFIIWLAVSQRPGPDPDANPSQQRLAEERIAPVAAVRVGAAGQAEIAAALAAAAPATDVAATAVDGKQVYDTVCTACHAAGVAGAPIPGSAMMAERLAAKGVDGLFSSVVNGLNVMPPRAGRPDLGDAEIRAALEFMLQ